MLQASGLEGLRWLGDGSLLKEPHGSWGAGSSEAFFDALGKGAGHGDGPAQGSDMAAKPDTTELLVSGLGLGSS